MINLALRNDSLELFWNVWTFGYCILCVYPLIDSFTVSHSRTVCVSVYMFDVNTEVYHHYYDWIHNHLFRMRSPKFTFNIMFVRTNPPKGNFHLYYTLTQWVEIICVSLHDNQFRITNFAAKKKMLVERERVDWVKSKQRILFVHDHVCMGEGLILFALNI